MLVWPRGRKSAGAAQYLVLVWPRDRESAAAVQYLGLVWPRGREGAAVPPTAAAWPRCDPHLLRDTARVSGRVSWQRRNEPGELEGIAKVVFVFLLFTKFVYVTGFGD